MLELPDARILLIEAVQAQHDDRCLDIECKCHLKEWRDDVKSFISAVAVSEADSVLAEIQHDAVWEYRFG